MYSTGLVRPDSGLREGDLGDGTGKETDRVEVETKDSQLATDVTYAL